MVNTGLTAQLSAINLPSFAKEYASQEQWEKEAKLAHAGPLHFRLHREVGYVYACDKNDYVRGKFHQNTRRGLVFSRS